MCKDFMQFRLPTPVDSRPVFDESNDTASAIGPALAPRETADELRERYRELEALEALVAREEAELGELRTDLLAFEAKYKAAVGPRYRELDRLDAEIAAAFAALTPDDETLQERAREARERADRTADAVEEEARRMEAAGCGIPSISLKRLYRRVALEMHPDRCLDEREAAYRNELMIEANRAYSEGDLATLEALLDEVEVEGEARLASLEMRSLLYRMQRLRRRHAEAKRERDSLESGELYSLLVKFSIAAREGRDLFKEKLDELDRRISRTRSRYEVLAAML
jgi:hypothetical protein